MPKWLSDDIVKPDAQAGQKPHSSQAVDRPDSEKLPLRHVAIIMDGNRRWADLRGLPRFMGHKDGVKSLKQLVRHVGQLQLGYLTVYAFSSENWQRSKEEVRYLFELFAKVLTEEFDELSESGVKLSFLGNLSQIPVKLSRQLEGAMERSKANKGLSLQIAINYGSRLEICEAVQKIAADVSAGKLSVEKIDDALISSYLYTKDIPDPELIIRTGGEMRLSNYLLWQAAYTELYVTDVLWPDFTADDFDGAIAEFSRRIRRYGGD
jgi:undecaprenyl diphosphate synthase